MTRRDIDIIVAFILCVAVVSTLAVIFQAAFDARINSGTVLSKEYVPSHVESSTRYDPSTKTYKSDSKTVPDQWLVTFYRGEKKRTVQVSNFAFDAIEKGLPVRMINGLLHEER